MMLRTRDSSEIDSGATLFDLTTLLVPDLTVQGQYTLYLDEA